MERVNHSNTTGMVESIELEIQIPPTFPEKVRDALIRAAGLCTVKKHLENPPMLGITTNVATPAGA